MMKKILYLHPLPNSVPDLLLLFFQNKIKIKKPKKNFFTKKKMKKIKVKLIGFLLIFLIIFSLTLWSIIELTIHAKRYDNWQNAHCNATNIVFEKNEESSSIKELDIQSYNPFFEPIFHIVFSNPNFCRQYFQKRGLTVGGIPAIKKENIPYCPQNGVILPCFLKIQNGKLQDIQLELSKIYNKKNYLYMLAWIGGILSVISSCALCFLLCNSCCIKNEVHPEPISIVPPLLIELPESFCPNHISTLNNLL